MSSTIKFAAGNVFRSDHGAGKMIATIMRISSDAVFMERREEGKKRATNFCLPLWFLSSRSCGWMELAGLCAPTAGATTKKEGAL